MKVWQTYYKHTHGHTHVQMYQWKYNHTDGHTHRLKIVTMDVLTDKYSKTEMPTLHIPAQKPKTQPCLYLNVM